MKLSRNSKAANSPNPAPKPRKRLFKTDKDSYLFKTAKEQKKAENMPPDMITQLKMAIDKLVYLSSTLHRPNVEAPREKNGAASWCQYSSRCLLSFVLSMLAPSIKANCLKEGR